MIGFVSNIDFILFILLLRRQWRAFMCLGIKNGKKKINSLGEKPRRSICRLKLRQFGVEKVFRIVKTD